MTDRRYVFIYSCQSNDRLEREGRDGLEDDLEEFLAGVGEVTGAGSGVRGWNVDLELEDEVDLEEWLERIAQFLRDWGVPPDTYLTVNGQARVEVFGPPD